MPCLLPEVLLPWLIERGIFWDIKDNEVRRYWQHHRSAKTCLAHVCETDDAIPIWLWGDAAQYNAKNESVVVLCCGCILDQRKASVSTCFPFVILREDPGLYLKYHFDNVHICYIYIYIFSVETILLYRPPLKPTPKEKSVGFSTLCAFLEPVPWLLTHPAFSTVSMSLPWYRLQYQENLIWLPYNLFSLGCSILSETLWRRGSNQWSTAKVYSDRNTRWLGLPGGVLVGNLRECFPKYAIYIYTIIWKKYIYIYILYKAPTPKKYVGLCPIWASWNPLWKANHKAWLGIKNFYKCNTICHCCHAHKSTYMRSPAKLAEFPRCSTDEFLREGVKPGQQRNSS